MDLIELKAQLLQKHPWILLVDDDLHITGGLKDILEDSGYRVRIAHLGEEAISALERHAFSVMVVDYSLPDTNGIELTRKLRRLHPELQVVLMTGHDRFEMQAADMTALFCAFLRKPVEIHNVTASIGRAVHEQCQGLQIPVFENRPTEFAPQPPDSPVLKGVTPRVSLRLWPVFLAGGLFLSGGGIGWLARGFVSASSLPASSAGMPLSSITTAATLETEPSRPALPAQAVPPKEAPAPLVEIKARPERSEPRHHPRSVETGPSELESKLSQKDFNVRLTAAKALLKQFPDHTRALHAVILMLKEPLGSHRVAAIETLSTAHCASTEAISALADRLADEDLSVSYAAVSALGHLGSAASGEVPELAQLLAYSGSGAQSVGHAAEESLVQIGKPGVVSLISQLDNPPLRHGIIHVLSRLGPDAAEAVPALTALVNDPDVGTDAQQALESIQVKNKPEVLTIDTTTHSGF